SAVMAVAAHVELADGKARRGHRVPVRPPGDRDRNAEDDRDADGQLQRRQHERPRPRFCRGPPGLATPPPPGRPGVARDEAVFGRGLERGAVRRFLGFPLAHGGTGPFALARMRASTSLRRRFTSPAPRAMTQSPGRASVASSLATSARSGSYETA